MFPALDRAPHAFTCWRCKFCSGHQPFQQTDERTEMRVGLCRCVADQRLRAPGVLVRLAPTPILHGRASEQVRCRAHLHGAGHDVLARTQAVSIAVPLFTAACNGIREMNGNQPCSSRDPALVTCAAMVLASCRRQQMLRRSSSWPLWPLPPPSACCACACRPATRAASNPQRWIPERKVMMRPFCHFRSLPTNSARASCSCHLSAQPGS